MNAIRDLVKVYASAQIRRDASTALNARFLKVFAFSDPEIADLLGISRQAVEKGLSKTKKDKIKTPTKESDDSSEEA
jgi:predicted transcriptional regulator